MPLHTCVKLLFSFLPIVVFNALEKGGIHAHTRNNKSTALMQPVHFHESFQLAPFVSFELCDVIILHAPPKARLFRLDFAGINRSFTPQPTNGSSRNFVKSVKINRHLRLCRCKKLHRILADSYAPLALRGVEIVFRIKRRQCYILEEGRGEGRGGRGKGMSRSRD